MNEWIIVGIVAIAVIFGATKLPEIARNLGRSSNEFKRGLKEGSEDEPAQPVQPVEPKPADPSASDN
jgi:sec-independent protein translocase protein TatA